MNHNITETYPNDTMSNPTVSIALYNLILTGSSSCLSILGATIIFLTYGLIPEIRNFTRKLLVYLTMADICTAAGNLVAVARYAYVHDIHSPVVENCSAQQSNTTLETMCEAQSFVTTFSNLSSFLWTAVIALHLWSCVVLRTERTEIFQMHILYHVICWIIPLIVVIVLLNNEYLGEDYCYGTGVWCGIRSDLDPKTIRTWMYVADIAWQLTCYILVCFLYIHLKFYIRLYYRGIELARFSRRLRNEDENFVFMWLILYLLKLWGLVRFFITTYVHPTALSSHSMQHALNFLLLMQSYGASGQAFWNCILFCFCDKAVRKRMKGWLKCCNSEERERLLGNLNTE